MSNELQVDSLKDIRISGFDLAITLPDGSVQNIPGGVTSLLKGDLSILGEDGAAFSRSDILRSVNLQGQAAVLVPELLTSVQDKAKPADQLLDTGQAEMTQQELEALKNRIEELKKIKEELEEQEKKAQEEAEGKQEAEGESDSELVGQLLEQMNEAIAAITPPPPEEEVGQPEPPEEDRRVEPNANIGMGTSSSSGSAPPVEAGEAEEESDLFVEVALASRSDSGGKGDFITNVNKPTFEVTSLPGAKITLSIDGVDHQATADSSGKAVIVFDEPLDDGDYPIIVKAVDEAGNEVTINQTLIIDTVPPTASLELAGDTGLSETDNIINVNEPTFTGTISGDPASVVLSVGDKSYNLTAQNGQFSFSLPDELADGDHNVVLTVVDEAGNQTVVRQTVTIDTVNEFSVTLSDKSDSGVGDDWITNVKDPEFRLEFEPGSIVQIIIDGKSYDVDTTVSSPTLFKLDAPLDEGAHTIRFVSTDMAGNLIEVDQVLVIDTTPPDFQFNGLAAGSDTGDPDDLLTSVTTPTFTGRGDAGTIVHLELDGIAYQTIVEDNGSWTLTIENPLPDKAYSLTVFAEDAAGNRSATTNKTITIDTKGAHIEGGLDAASDSGVSASDGITHAEDLVFTGNTEPNIAVTLTIDALGITETVTSDDEGNFSFATTRPSPIPEGTYRYVITSVDAAGNVSVPLQGNVVVDRKITDFSAGLDIKSDTGAESDDGLTSVKTPTIIGTGEPGATITVTISNTTGSVNETYGFIRVDDKGKWDFTFPETLVDDSYIVSVTVRDLAGNSATQELPVTIDTTVILTARMTGETDADSGITNNDLPSFSGTCDPDSTITLILQHADTGQSITLTARADNKGEWSIAVPENQALTAQGEWTWNVAATDRAGNQATPVNGTFDLDTIAPTVTVTLASETGSDDTHTNDNTLDLAVRTEPGSQVSVAVFRVEAGGIAGGTPVYQSSSPQTMPGTGELVCSVPELTDGNYVYQVTVTDVAGNSTTTGQQPVTIDTQPPTLGAIDLTDASDTNIVGDQITNKTELTFSGSESEIGSTIRVTVQNKITGEIIKLEPASFKVESADWIYRVPASLQDGTYSITFVAEDTAGNLSPGKAVDVEVDTTVPIMGAVSLSSGSDTGVSASDFITSDKDPSFSGSCSKGDTVTVAIYRDEVLIKTAITTVTNDDGTWSVEVAGLSDGNYHWVVTARDVAGNETRLDSDDQTLTIDSQYIGATGKLDDASNTGFDTDNITSEQNVIVSGRGEPGSTVTLKGLVGPDANPIDVTSVEATTSAADGSWSLNLPTLGAGDGVYTWTIELRDIAGNAKEVTGTVQLDTTTVVDGKLASDDGLSVTDNITSDATPTFSGTGEVGGTVRLVITDPNNQVLDNIPTAVVAKSGTWQITVPELPMDGQYKWKAEITDVAGNVSSTEDKTFMLDTSVPAIVELRLDSPVGFATDIPNIKDNSPEFSGRTSEINGQVKLHIYSVTGGVVSGEPLYSSKEVRADNNGDFSITVDRALPDGEYRWVLEVVDVAGNRGVSEQQKMIVDTKIPIIIHADLSEDSDTGLAGSDGITKDDRPTFSGQAEVGTRISIELTNASGARVPLQPDYVVVGSDGNWSYTPQSVLPDGNYTWVARVMDAAGNEAISNTVNLTIDTEPPSLTDVSLASASDSGTLSSDGITSDTTPTFNGVAEKGCRIELRIFDTKTPGTPVQTLDTTVTDNNGSWSITPISGLTDGSYSWTITATDVAGNETVFSSQQTLVIDTKIVNFTAGMDSGSDTGGSDSDQITNATQVNLKGTGEAGAKVVLKSLINTETDQLVDLTNVAVTVDAEGNWTLSTPGLGDDGNYKWVVEVTDVAGNTGTREGQFTLDRTISVTGGLDDASDSGYLDSDDITNNQTPTLSGTGQDGDTITVRLMGPGGYFQELETTVAGGVWNVSVTDDQALTADGSYSWTVIATDIAGNQATDQGSFTLDTTAATATLTLVNDTGLDPGDNLTNDNALSINAQIVGNARTVQLIVWRADGSVNDPVFDKEQILDKDAGEYTFTTSELNDGSYLYKVIVTDAAGNISESPTQNVTVDTQVPVLGVVTQGDVSNGTYVNDASVSFSGTTEANARVYLVLTRETGEKITVSPIYVEANDDGSWSYTLAPEVASTLVDGSYNWSFMAVDQAGNISAAREGHFTLDTDVPEVTFTGLTGASDTGDQQDDMLTNVARPVFTGTVSENAFVTVTLNSVPPGKTYSFTTATSVDGQWQLAATTDLPEGVFTVQVSATDLAGNEGNAVVHETQLTIDRTITGGDDVQLAASSDTGDQGDQLTNLDTVTITGKVEPGSSVTLKSLTAPSGAGIAVDDVAAVSANETDGSWSLTLPQLSGEQGIYTYVIAFADNAGNVKEVTKTFTYDTEINITADLDANEVEHEGTTYTRDETPSFTGTGTQGDRITLTLTGPGNYSGVFNAVVDAQGKWTLNVTPPLASDGSYSWSIVATDAAGNTDNSQNGHFTLDTIPPTAIVTLASDEGHSETDGITNQQILSLHVTTAGNATSVQLQLWQKGQPGTLLVDLTKQLTDGTSHTFTTTELPEGQYEYQVIVTDVAGNVGSSPVGSVTIDTTPPQLSDVVIDDVQNGEYVNEQGFTFRGTAEADSRIILTLTDQRGNTVAIAPGSVTADKGGNWHYSLETNLDDGEYTWSFVAEDVAGNRSDAVTGSVIMDSMAPVVDYQGLGDSDTGDSAFDNITKDQTPLFTGTVTEVAKVTVVLTSTDGQTSYTFQTPDYVDGNWSITATESIADGSYTVRVTATDMAGNTSATDTGTLKIDTGIEGGDAGSFGLSDDSDSGVADDNITNEQSVSLSGTVEAGVKVTLTELRGPGGTPINLDNIQPVTAGSNGSWTLALPDGVLTAEGRYTYTLQYADVAGNIKTVSGSMTVDRTIEVTAAFGSQTGDDGEIIYSNTETQEFSGTGTEGDRVTLTLTRSDNTKTTLETTVGSDGTWSMSAPGLADGVYQWSVTAVDAAGNTQEPITGSFTLDTTPPVLTAMGLTAASDSGFVSDDNITADKTPDFSVSGEVGSKVFIQVWAGNSTTGTPSWSSTLVEIPASGTATIPVPEASALSDGNYTWTVMLTDVAGNETVSPAQSLTIDTTAPTVPTLDLISDTGTSTTDNLTNDNTPLFQGTGEPGTRISLVITNAAGNILTVEPAYVEVGQNGNWSLLLTSELGDGVYSVAAQAMDQAGNTSNSAPFTVTIDTAAPTLQSARMLAETDSGNTEDNITNVSRPEFVGVSEASAVITLVISRLSDQGGMEELYTLTARADSDGNWHIADVPELGDGGYFWSVSAKDAAGNESEAYNDSFIIDTSISEFSVQLADSSDTGMSGDDNITNQTSVRIEGRGEDRATVTLTELNYDGAPIDVSNVAGVTVSNGIWSLSLPTLGAGDGIYNYTVVIVDIAGNEQELKGSVTLDTSMPEVTASVEKASDLGSSDIDGITRDTTPTFSGSVSEKSEVTLKIQQGSTTVATYGPIETAGNWSIQVDTPLPDGTYTWSVEAMDVAGNVATTSGKTLVIDTAPPELTISLDSETDTGESQSDGITNATNLKFTGNILGEGSSEVTLRFQFGPANGQMQYIEQTVTSGETFEFDVSVPNDGLYSWSIIATDIAGNETEKIGTVTVDTTLADFSAETGLDSSSDTGTADDNKSKDTTPTFIGKTEANATVTLTMLFAGSRVVEVEATADNDGNFTISVPASSALGSDGTYQWQLEAVDVAGNTKVKEGSYILDTTPPDITFDLAFDSGDDDDDWLTNVQPIVVNGTSDDKANVVVTLLSGSTVINTQTLNLTDGKWQYTYEEDLEDGTYTFKVESTDAAGNVFIDEQVLVVDTEVVNTFKLSSDTGVADDQLTNAEYLEFTGTTDKDATLSLVIKNAQGVTINTYSPTVNTSNGQWSFEIPQELAEGTYTVNVTATDAAGNTNTSEDYSVTIDRTPPALDSIMMASDDDTGIKDDWITETRQITINGNASAGASVEIIISGVNLPVTATVNSEGKFTAELPELAYGDYQLTIRAKDIAGNTTEISKDLTISPDKLPFVAELSSESDSGIQDDNVTNVTTPTLSGSATPSYQVEATINGQKVTATADLGGSWSLVLPGPLEEGSHTVQFVIKDPAGNIQENHSYTFTVDTSVEATIQIDAESDSGEQGDFITNSEHVYITGGTEAGVTLEIRNKETDKVLSEIVTTEDNWGYLLTGLSEGEHTFVVEMTDQAGNTNSKEFTVTIDRTPPVLTVQVGGETDIGAMVSSQLEQTFSGTVTGGVSSLILTINGDNITITPDENGAWSHTMELDEGINNFSVTASDVAGNQAMVQGTVNVKTQINFQMELENDTGQFATDKILSGDKLVFGGTGGVGDSVVLVLTSSGGEEVGRITINIGASGQWSHEFTGLEDGQYTITANISDDAGNTATRTISEIVVDNINIGFAADLLDSDGVAADNIVKESRPTFSGTGEVGSEVVLTIDGVSYNTKVSSTGSWQFQLPDALADGQHSITIYSIDLAGNESTAKTIEFTTDTRIPELTYELEGVVDNDGVQYINSSQQNVVFKGTVSEAGKIMIQINNQEFTQEMTAGDDWSIDVGNIVEREHAYTVTFEDIAGNVVTESGTVVVDRTINTYVTLTDSYDSHAPGISSYSDAITNSRNLQISFDRGVNRTDKDLTASVVVTGPDGFHETYSGISTASGVWTLPETLTTDGLYTFNWTFEDAAGNTATQNMSVRLDTQVAAIDIGDLSYDGVGMVAGEDLIVGSELISLSFKPPANSEYVRVVIVVNGTEYDARSLDSEWRFIGVPLEPGENVLTIKAWDVAGNLATTTQNVVVKTGFTTLDLAIDGEMVSDLTNIEDIYSKDPDRTIALSGRIDVGSSIVIIVDGAPIKPAPTVDSLGNWSCDLALSEGNNKVSIRFTDAAGNVEVVNFNTVIDTVKPILTVDEITGDGYQVINGENYIRGNSVNLSGRVDTGTTVQSVMVNGTEIALSGLLLSEGVWSLEVSDLKEGDNTIVINSLDKAGNTTVETLTITRDTKVTDFSVVTTEDGAHVPDFSGTGEAGSSVRVIITDATGKETTVDTKVDNDGNWQVVTADQNFADGNYTWKVEVVDVAGNTHEEGGQFVLDTAVSELTANLAATEDTTSDARSFIGTVEPGSAVVVTLTPFGINEVTVTINANVDGNGNWTATAVDLPDAEYSWSVTATDAAGNSATEQGGSFTVDTEVSNMTGALVDDDNNGVVNTAPAFTGTVEPGANVTVTVTSADGATIITTINADVDANGQWTASSSGLTDGSYSWSAAVTDSAGNLATIEGKVFTLDTQLSGLTGVLTDIGDDGTISDLPSFTGVVEPGSDVQVELTNQETNETITLDAVVGKDGSWTASAADLAAGNYNWSVSAKDVAGNTDTFDGGRFTFSTPDVVPIPPEETLPPESTPVAASESELLETRAFVGESIPDSLVTLEVAGEVYETLADADGDWAIRAEFRQSGSFDYQLQYQNPVGEPVIEHGRLVVKSVDFGSLDSRDRSVDSGGQHDRHRDVAAADVTPPAIDPFDTDHHQDY